jgi:hypothetical protein
MSDIAELIKAFTEGEDLNLSEEEQMILEMMTNKTGDEAIYELLILMMDDMEIPRKDSIKSRIAKFKSTMPTA